VCVCVWCEGCGVGVCVWVWCVCVCFVTKQPFIFLLICRGQLKCDGTRADTRFRLSAQRTRPFKSAGGRQFSRLLAADVCASAVVMLDTPCSEVVWRVLATHCIRQFPLYFPSLASPCTITFQLESTDQIFIVQREAKQEPLRPEVSLVHGTSVFSVSHSANSALV